MLTKYDYADSEKGPRSIYQATKKHIMFWIFLLHSLFEYDLRVYSVHRQTSTSTPELFDIKYTIVI